MSRPKSPWGLRAGLCALLALPLVVGGLAGVREAEAGAPPLSWTYRDKVDKYSFKMFRDYTQIPLKTGSTRVICKFGDPKNKGQNKGTLDAEIEVIRLGAAGPVTTAGGGENPTRPGRPSLPEPTNPIDAALGWMSRSPKVTKIVEAVRKKFKKIKSKDRPPVPGKLWQFDVPVQTWGGEIEAHYSIAAFERDGQTLVLSMMCGDKLTKDFKPKFKSIAKSFRWHDAKAKDVETLDVLEGVNISAKKRSDIERGMVKGWNVIVSPKKNYVVLYNTKNGKNHLLAKVIAKRIELIREQIYEVQFPPAKPIDTVCIVRVCGDLNEYHQYGGPGGSAGYWSPMDEELVFYDASASKKPDDNTLSVLYHEAFHQYIHYSVGRVAPHSWFNEGHGDYYAGAKLKGGKFRIGPFRWRVGVIRNAIVQGERPYEEVIDEETGKVKSRMYEPKGYTPLEHLVRFTQREYYSYPSVCYAQGWSLIYFLREIVPKNKKYREKWGHILDVYFDTLKAEVNKDTSPEDQLKGDEDEPGPAPEPDGPPAPPTTPPSTPTDETPKPDGDKPAPDAPAPDAPAPDAPAPDVPAPDAPAPDAPAPDAPAPDAPAPDAPAPDAPAPDAPAPDAPAPDAPAPDAPAPDAPAPDAPAPDAPAPDAPAPDAPAPDAPAPDAPAPDAPAPDAPAPDDGDSDDGGDGDDGEDGDDEGEPGPGNFEAPKVMFRGRGGPAALRKAVEEAFKGIDWAEFQAAWLKATKRGR